MKLKIEVGTKIKLVRVVGESKYNGKIGIVKSIDDIGQLHGNWGGIAIIPEIDIIKIIKDFSI